MSRVSRRHGQGWASQQGREERSAPAAAPQHQPTDRQRGRPPAARQPTMAARQHGCQPAPRQSTSISQQHSNRHCQPAPTRVGDHGVVEGLGHLLDRGAGSHLGLAGSLQLGGLGACGRRGEPSGGWHTRIIMPGSADRCSRRGEQQLCRQPAEGLARHTPLASTKPF